MIGHVHTPGDGRGRRRVLVDGREVKRAVYANTVTGEVRQLEDPIRIEGNEPAVHTVHGRVEVEFING
ncbi:hypothetical protein [Stenotrophomonas maltophilia]|uniref:hypothetical protein n=1 Tax=Stenotrophomonas maltophilia TaxID=40324 RepID=UPI000C14CA82|nr:hypothetical protein [Stenotrophomonas maltophilia]